MTRKTEREVHEIFSELQPDLQNHAISVLQLIRDTQRAMLCSADQTHRPATPAKKG